MRSNSQDATCIHNAQASLPLRLFRTLLTRLSGCRASSAHIATLSLHFILWTYTNNFGCCHASWECSVSLVAPVTWSELNLLVLFVYIYTVSHVINVLMPCRVVECQAEPWHAIKLIPVCKWRHHSETSWCTGEVSHWPCTLLAFVYPGVRKSSR